MVKKSTLKFLKNLKSNNNREWFNENKNRYLEAKEDFEGFIQELLKNLGKLDEDLANLEAKSSIFRIYRDVRFSKDKSPYKTNFGASFNKGGRKVAFPGYYIHVLPGNIMIGGGLYHPETKLLKAVRQEIDYNDVAFLKIVEDKEFVETYGEVWGDRLKKAPKGYDPNHKMIEYLKMKDFVFMHTMKDSILTESGSIDYIIEKYSQLQPFVAFLKQPLFDIEYA